VSASALRKPLGEMMPRMESREPRSIRFSPSEWSAICQAARLRAEEPSRFVRRLAMYALSIVQAQASAEASIGMTGFGRL